MKGIKNIIFDFGGVILNIDLQLAYNAFMKLGIPGFDSIGDKVLSSELIVKLERGDISPDDFRKSLRALSENKITDQEIDQAWNAMLLDLPAARIRVLEQLKGKYRTFLLSNSNKIHYDYYVSELKRVHGYNNFGELLEKDYFSHDIGLSKPAADIYEFVLKDSNLKASESLFIDDTYANIETAEKLGISCIHLTQGNTINKIFGID